LPKDEYRRKLAAILSADAQDYSRLMSEDEKGTVRAIQSHFRDMSTRIGIYRGRVVDNSGDNLLAEFPSVVDAVQCAVEIQKNLKSRNAGLPENRRMVFRIGINLGDVIEEDARIYGDGVSIAARIERLADGGGICISGTVYEQVKNKLPVGYEDQGEISVKNIPEPIRVYTVVPDATGPGIRRSWHIGARPWRRALLAAIPGVIVAVVAMALWSASPRRSPPAVKIAAGRLSESPNPAPDAGPPHPVMPAVATPSALKPRPPSSPVRTLPEKLPGVPLPEAPSLAVLPFENLSGDPDQEFLNNGFTDDVITTLSKLPRLFVISRSSTSRYKGKPAKVEEIARDLGVRYVLEGSIQRSGNRLRVNAQLLDGETGRHVWADRYDRAESEFFKIRDNIILDLASALAGKLTDGDVAKISRRNTGSLEAWEAYQRGRFFHERYTRDDNLRAREWYRKAAELDPEYLSAWQNIGWTYYIEGRSFATGEARDRAFAQALEVADKVLEMDSSYYGSYFLRAGVYTRLGRHEDAVANGRKAYEMEPNATETAAMLGGELNYAGNPEEAISLFGKAMRLSPYYRPWYLDGLGLAYHLTGQTDKAIESFKASAKRDPKAVYPHLRLAMIYAEQGREEERRAEAAEVLRLSPKFSVAAWTKVHTFKDPKIQEYRKALMLKAGLPE
jgi:TolB-like protein/class 3 adenylate cyclase/Tfp pilus assembly protein PilF